VGRRGRPHLRVGLCCAEGDTRIWSVPGSRHAE